MALPDAGGPVHHPPREENPTSMTTVTDNDSAHPVDRHVGRRVRERRLGLGYRQGDLARALGLTFQQVQKYESGANRISASKLWDTADFLQVGINYFFEGYVDEAHGVAETPAFFDHGPSASRYTVQIARLAPRLSLTQQKLVVGIIADMAQAGDPED